MRVLVDTNVIFSALLTPNGPPARLMALQAEGRIELCAPLAVKRELSRILQSKAGYSGPEVEATCEALGIDWLADALWESHRAQAVAALSDPTDAPIVAASMALGMPLVTGDAQTRRRASRLVWTMTPLEAVNVAQTLEPKA